MKTNLILKAALTMMFCGIIYYSCTNPDTPANPSLIGADPVGPDRPIPYYYGDWMKFIDNNKYLSEITIPGTHDAGADYHTSEQGAMSDITIAQDFRISNQLLIGVRWFDIRLHDDEGTMTVFHGPYYLHKNFTDLILPTLGFLDSHPTEVVVFMIKQEHSSRGDDAFANGIMGYLNWVHPGRFWMGDHIPQLSEVRGQVVIVRQFWGTHGYAMGVPLIWNDNTTGSYGNSDPGIYLYAQDHYSLNSVSLDTKIFEILDCIEKAYNEPYPYRCYYLNFTSGEQDVAMVPLQYIAAYINPRINTFLLSKPTWHNCGVIFVNFAGGSDDGVVPNDLVKTIVNQNDFSQTVIIGTQNWANHNLNVTKYRNGDLIPNVTDPTEWQNLTTGAYCDYANGGPNDYGKLYNWYAVNDPRGLAPAGWHIASNAEWTTLVNYVGGASVAAGKLKDAGTIHWWWPNTGATNQFLFTAYPGGARWGETFGSCGETGMFWTSTASGVNAVSIWMNFDNPGVQYQNYPKINGFSVRCIKD